jgi:DNA-binding NarL/FixJ family response regulator
MRVVIVDDDRLFRSGLRELLERDGIQVVEELSSADALETVSRIGPDVVTLEPSQPGLTAAEATRRIATLQPEPKILAIAGSSDAGDVTGCIEAGASGYVLKDSSEADLVGAVRAVAGGGAAFSPSPAMTLVELVRVALSEEPEVADLGLSSRELEVLRLVAAGKDNAEIAGELFISSETVKNHMSKILSKLPVDNRTQAAVYAVRARLV